MAIENSNCLRTEWTNWQGEAAVRFCAGGYEALLIPSVGGNLIQLKDNVRGLELLRTPDDVEIFKKRPQVYGIPVLFPPNRIEDGTFKVGDKEYIFPINEPNNNHNHIHGFLRTRAWKVTRMETVDNKAEVEITFIADKTTDFYEYFPHEFEFKILYTLSESGLEQLVTIINKSDSPMPMGLGFHTAFKIPFHPESDGSDYFLRISINEEWELGPRVLPTGKIYPLNDNDKKYRKDGVEVQGSPISGHYTSLPLDIEGTKFHGAIIEDRSKGLKLIYEVGEGYKHWMIWNETGDNGFICPEPQTWAVNAPNIKLSSDVTGFRMLSPEETWQDKCRIFMQE